MSKRAPPVTTVKSAAQHQAELKKQAAKALKTKTRKPTPPTGKIKCPLCGLLVPRSAMLGHKMNVHAELPFGPTPELPHSENLWVPIYRGGATGLKK